VPELRITAQRAGGIMMPAPPRGRLYYAVLAMTDMSRQPVGVPLVLADIARRHGLPQRYLEQICNRLRRAGLLQGVRGPGGGYRLARPAEQVTIAEIAAAAEGDAGEAQAARSGLLTADCPVCRLFGAFQNHAARFLETVTLADVSAGRIPGCEEAAGQERPETGADPVARRPAAA